MAALHEQLEILLGWHVAAHFQREEPSEEAVETVEVGQVFHLRKHQCVALHALHALLHLLGKTLFGSLRVERIVDGRPMDGEVVVTAERLVSKHLLAEFRHLDVEAHLTSEFTRYRIDHQAEHPFAVNIFFILAFAIDSALREQVRRHERPSAAQHGQEVGHHLPVFSRHHHIGLLASALLQNAKQLRAMEELASAHRRQLGALRDNLYVIVVGHAVNRHIICKNND